MPGGVALTLPDFSTVAPVRAAQLQALVDAIQARTPIWVTKTVDESVSSSITVQDDNELRVTLPPNGRWRVDLDARVSGATAGDLRSAWTDPADLTLLTRFVWGLGSNETAADDQVVRFQTPTFITSQVGTGTTAGSPYRETLFVTTGASAADLRFQWAQVTSNATATNVLAGSSIVVTPLV